MIFQKFIYLWLSYNFYPVQVCCELSIIWIKYLVNKRINMELNSTDIALFSFVDLLVLYKLNYIDINSYSLHSINFFNIIPQKFSKNSKKGQPINFSKNEHDLSFNIYINLSRIIISYTFRYISFLLIFY